MRSHIPPTEEIECRYSGVCGGCPWIEMPLSEQLELKLLSVADIFPKERIVVLQPGVSRLRDRVDLTLHQGRLGLWNRYETLSEASPREIVDLKDCPMMSEPLEKWFKEFRQKLPQVDKGSIRLRISPQGQKGVWLDFANEDVAKLFEEREYLKDLSSKAVVEIGQRKKPLYFEDEKPRLQKNPEYHTWHETYGLGAKTYPVFGVIGGFTQSGLKANKFLVQTVLGMVKKSGHLDWVEAFCGSGNFTLPLSSVCDRVLAVEADEMSLEALSLGLKKSNIKNVNVKRVDLKSAKQTGNLIQDISFSGAYGLLVDPPRSGLMSLLDQLSDGLIDPKSIVYVSCFTDSFKSDLERLKAIGYTLSELSLVDQFPHSSHVEWVALLKLES